MPNRFQPKGNLVVVALLLLTGFVGALFIILGPNATERSPGVLHVGVRYDDESAMRFARYGKNGPGARVDFIAPQGLTAYTVENLQTGRNLVPMAPTSFPPESIPHDSARPATSQSKFPSSPLDVCSTHKKELNYPKTPALTTTSSAPDCKAKHSSYQCKANGLQSTLIAQLPT